MQFDTNKANWNKLQYQPVAASREEEIVRLMFSYCECTSDIKLSTKWQMALLVKKVNVDMTDEMVMLVALHVVENCKPCNKHLYLLIRYLSLVTRKIPVVDFKSQLDSI